MKSEKDQRNILPIKKKPWVCGLIFPLVRFYGFGIFGINDNDSEVKSHGKFISY